MHKLLFIDDDEELLLSNRLYFSREGYQVETAGDPEAALALLRHFTPDCILLDVMLPGLSGFELYRPIRELCSAPVIFLSGRADEDSRITGLLTGGNDYVVKPYSLRELAARIQVQLRTTTAAVPPAKLSFPPLSIDLLEHRAYCREDEIPLSNMEYQLLALLASRPGETVSFEEIGQEVWGHYSDSARRTIMVSISRLRKKLEEHDALGSFIETVWAKGYIFTGNRRRDS